MLLKPVQTRRVSKDVADQLRQLIFAREFAPGKKLPPERELAARLEVHRSSVREALKRLESEGLLEIRRGDGTHVLDFLKEANLATLEGFLFAPQGLKSDFFQSIQEFRVLLQKEMARLAARRRKRSDLTELQSILKEAESVDDPPRFRALDWAFFQNLARATQNILFTMVLNSVREIHERWGSLFFAVPDTIKTTRRFHRLLANAVRRKDERRAASVMEKLLEYSNPILLESLPKALRRERRP